MLAQPGIGRAMEPLSAVEQEEINQALKEIASLNVNQVVAQAQAEALADAQKAGKNSQSIHPNKLTHLPGFIRSSLEGMQSLLNKTKTVASNFQKERETAKWQNTIVLGHPKSPVALYKRDCIELPFLISDVALAYWFFYTFRQNRIKHIQTAFTENIDWYIEKFERIEQMNKKIADTDPNLSFTEIMTQHKELLEEHETIWLEIADSHHYLGYNPFKREIIMPFLGAILGHKTSSYLQGKLLVKQSFTPDALFAYKPDGTPFQLDKMWAPSITAVQNDIANMQAKIPKTRYTIQQRNTQGNWEDMQNPPIDPTTLTNEEMWRLLWDYNNDIEYAETMHIAKGTANPLRIAQAQPDPQEILETDDASFKAVTTAFKETVKGLVFWHGAPIGTSTALKALFVSNPNAPSLDYGPPLKKTAEGVQEGVHMVIPEGTITRAWYKFLGLPNWFYTVKNSAPARYALEVAIMCGSLYVVNSAYQQEWLKNMREETTQLKALLYAYKATQHLPDIDRDKKKVLKDLHRFIATGNSITGTGIKSAVKELFNVHNIGKANITFKITAWMVTIMNALLLWKLRHLRSVWPYGKLMWQAGYINPQGALIGSLVATYISCYTLLPYSLVSTAYASSVIADIKAAAGVIKKFFKRRSTSPEEESEKQNETTEEVINTNESNDTEEVYYDTVQ